MAKNYNRTLTEDELKEVFKTGFILIGSSFVFMGVLALLVHSETIRLYPMSVNKEQVEGFAGRVEFAFKYQTLLALWLLINIVATIYTRVSTKAVNPLDEKSEHHVHMVKHILTNSFEQIVLSILAQLAFVAFASKPECVLKVIPLVNILQFIGRIAFYHGYPYKRAFGFACTAMPTFVLIAYNVYAFGKFLVS